MVFGIRNSNVLESTDLSVDTPAECARKLIAGQVDIGLVPVVVIPEIKDAKIISDYCIGANGPVRSVVLASQVPLEEISNIVLDPNSRTSVTLIKIIAKEFWKKHFTYSEGLQGFEINDITGNTAGVVIGDKVFGIEKKYRYIYDLAEVWKSFTSLPFVFAAWVANKPIDSNYLKAFNKAIYYGITNLNLVVEKYAEKPIITKTELLHYFQNNIDFILDDNKNKAIKLFLEKCKTTAL